MKIIFSCIHFPVWPYPPQNNEKNVFYTGKLYGLTGMWNMHYAHFEPSLLYTDILSSPEISFLVLLHVATL